MCFGCISRSSLDSPYIADKGFTIAHICNREYMPYVAIAQGGGCRHRSTHKKNTIVTWPTQWTETYVITNYQRTTHFLCSTTLSSVEWNCGRNFCVSLFVQTAWANEITILSQKIMIVDIIRCFFFCGIGWILWHILLDEIFVWELNWGILPMIYNKNNSSWPRFTLITPKMYCQR